MRRALGRAALGLLAFGSLGMTVAPTASAAPSAPFHQESILAADQAHRWKAECWWIDDRKADERRWGTARGNGTTRGGAIRHARNDIPDGAFIHHCDSHH